MELAMPKQEALGILSLKQIQTLISLSIKMLRGFSRALQQATSSLQSLKGVLGLLEGKAQIKKNLKEIGQKIRE